MPHLSQLGNYDTSREADELDYESEYYNIPDSRIIDMLSEADFYSDKDGCR